MIINSLILTLSFIRRYQLKAGSNFYLTKQLTIIKNHNSHKLSYDNKIKSRVATKGLKIEYWENNELIGLQSMIIPTFYKHTSKISLKFPKKFGPYCIYFWNDDETLKLCSDDNKIYLFSIELDSESGNLWENTQFKIRINE